jgi:hypothetical protein
MGFRGNHPYRIAALSRAYLACNRIEDALVTGNKALQMARLQGEVFAQATALCVLADAERAAGRDSKPDADSYLKQALELSRKHGLLLIEQCCERALERHTVVEPQKGRSIEC